MIPAFGYVCSCNYEPAHYESLVLIAYAHKFPISVHADLSSGARGQIFPLSLHI